MLKSLLLTLFLSASIIMASMVSAEELSIVGNGAGSSATITVNSGSTVTQTQTNSANLTTTISASSKTGGNSASGNSGDTTIVTGDSSVDVKIKNLINANLGESSCCDPTVTPKPSFPVGGDDIKPPSNPHQPQSSSEAVIPSSVAGGAPGQVLGLPVTSAADPVSALVSTLGLVCLAAAALHLKAISS